MIELLQFMLKSFVFWVVFGGLSLILIYKYPDRKSRYLTLFSSCLGIFIGFSVIWNMLFMLFKEKIEWSNAFWKVEGALGIGVIISFFVFAVASVSGKKKSEVKFWTSNPLKAFKGGFFLSIGALLVMLIGMGISIIIYLALRKLGIVKYPIF